MSHVPVKGVIAPRRKIVKAQMMIKSDFSFVKDFAHLFKSVRGSLPLPFTWPFGKGLMVVCAFPLQGLMGNCCLPFPGPFLNSLDHKIVFSEKSNFNFSNFFGVFCTIPLTPLAPPAIDLYRSPPGSCSIFPSLALS